MGPGALGAPSPSANAGTSRAAGRRSPSGYQRPRRAVSTTSTAPGDVRPAATRLSLARTIGGCVVAREMPNALGLPVSGSASNAPSTVQRRNEIRALPPAMGFLGVSMFPRYDPRPFLTRLSLALRRLRRDP